MTTLSPEEEEQARALRVWSVIETVSLTRRVVSWHWTEASATDDQQERGGPPGIETRGFLVTPASLFAALQAGAFSPEEVRRRLAYQHGPLTEEEKTRAASLKVWIVWYEDTFGHGEDRDPPAAVGFHLDESAARADAAERGGVQEGNFERYTVTSGVLLDAFKDPRRQPGILRDLLRQSESRG